MSQTPTSLPSGWRRAAMTLLAVFMALTPILAGFHEEPNLLQIVATLLALVGAAGVGYLSTATPAPVLPAGQKKESY